MNRLLLDPSELNDAGVVRLVGRRARHLVEVLRVDRGRRVRTAVLDVGRTEATVRAVGEDWVELAIDDEPTPPLPEPELRLILALPRPKTVRRIVLDATTLGVTRIDLVNAWRVEKSYFDSPLLAAERLSAAARLGAEQGDRCRLPQIEVHSRLMPLLSSLEILPSVAALLAQPGAPHGVVDQLGERRPEAYWLALGPERGWIEREVQTLVEVGFAPVQLCAGILRSEAAVVAALAQVLLVRDRGREVEAPVRVGDQSG